MFVAVFVAVYVSVLVGVGVGVVVGVVVGVGVVMKGGRDLRRPMACSVAARRQHPTSNRPAFPLLPVQAPGNCRVAGLMALYACV